MMTGKGLSYSGRDVPWLVEHHATHHADHVFLIWEPFQGPSRSWTYKTFADDVSSIAAGLIARGVCAGDRVLIHLDNCPELILAWYACARIGAVAVTTNTRSVGNDLAYFAEHSEIVGAITQPALADLVAANAENISWMVVIETNPTAKAPEEKRRGGYEPFSSLYGDPEKAPDRAHDPMSPVGIQYTSGTTSRPKAVLWTHANALWGAQVNACHFMLRSDDITLCFNPLFHTNAQAYSVLASLWVGATVVLLPKFSVSRFWEVSLRHKCTWASMIPFSVKALMTVEIPARHHYRFWGVAVSLPQVEEAFGVKTLGFWGMTETITHGVVGNLHQKEPLMSIGYPAPEYDIAVVDDDGSPVESGETGHLLIRGVRGISLFLEYFKNPEATRDSFDEAGWFHTGDLVTVTKEGHFLFADRDKDMLKVGAENVATAEIEGVINATGVVNEVAVVGQKHRMLDEVPVAFVIPLPHAPENIEEIILSACRKDLADFKVPTAVYIVDEFPRSTLEKISKVDLRKRLPEI
ncbi:MAG: AMP-binding protein [Deltaproteobacteria bacterium]|nr:AMP-binding protein [Deltaproteobacteria bacterium]